MYDSLEELMEETEKNMASYSENREYCFSMYDMLRKRLDNCIKSRDYKSLSDLLPYYEKREAFPRLIHSGETLRIYASVKFTLAELEAGKEPFLSSVSSYDEFLQQYTLTVFSFRRLELALSETAMEEAMVYLQSIPLTVYAARIISRCEYFENFQRLYWNLYLCMRHCWPLLDKIGWLTFLTKKAKSMEIITELSSLYIENGEYTKAYLYLLQIPSPTQEIADIITSLGDYIK